jgi:uncharacterized phage-associated protein/DNA-binding transcriptional regulator YiaG
MEFCDYCKQERAYETKKKTGTYTVRGKEIEATYDIAICTECGHEMDVEEIEAAAMRVITDQYALQYGMPTIEIRAVREQFKGLGVRPFAKLISIGSASVSRIEAGELPSDKQLKIYQDLKDNPSRILAYFEANKNTLSPRELKKTHAILDAWNAEKTGERIVSPPLGQDDEEIIEAIYKPYAHTELSGFTSFNLEKFMHMVLYFAKEGVNKTKLMKLLWYCDFVYFKRKSVSISGAAYARLRFGPVPKDHEIMLAHLQHMAAIVIEETILNEEGWTLMMVNAKQSFNPELFEAAELAVLSEVESKFRSFGSRQISEYSHQERAWIETPEHEPIDYSFATDLREFPLFLVMGD